MSLLMLSEYKRKLLGFPPEIIRKLEVNFKLKKLKLTVHT